MKQGSHRLRSRLAAVTGGLAVAATLGITYAGGAGASLSPTVFGTSSVAGYYAAPNANRLANGDHVTGVRTSFFLLQAAKYDNGGADLGVELCQYQALHGVGGVADLYAKWNKGANVWDIYAAHHFTTDCLNGLANSQPATLIDTIPDGHQVFLAITVDRHHVVTYTDSDQTTLTGGATTFGGFTFGFNRAGVGTDANTEFLTTPANVKLVRFTSSAVRLAHGGTAPWKLIGNTGLTSIITVGVDETVDGNVLVFPTRPPTGAAFKLFRGQASN